MNRFTLHWSLDDNSIYVFDTHEDQNVITVAFDSSEVRCQSRAVKVSLLKELVGELAVGARLE